MMEERGMKLHRLKQRMASRSRAFKDAVAISALTLVVFTLAMNFDEFNRVVAWLHHHDARRLEVFFTVVVLMLPASVFYTWRRHKELKVYVRRLAEAEQAKARLEPALEDALADLTVLQGLLPICHSCKRVRDDTGYWNQVEVYIEARLNRRLDHGLCPECARKIYGQQR